MNYGFVIDNRKCIGCHACTIACKAEHDVPLGVNRTWVKYIEKGTFPDTRRFFSVLRCNHCADAPCVTICPVTAMFAREDGIVDFDPERCIGCKACIQACPYDAISIDPSTHTATKCNFCAHRIDSGREPPCAVVCPEQAIIAGDLQDPQSAIARLVQREQVSVRKPEKGTGPRVFYIGADHASLVPAATTVPEEYIWSQARRPGLPPYPTPRAEAGTAPARPSGGGGGPAIPGVVGRGGDAWRVYDTGQTHRDSWGWKVSAYLWTKSIAAGCLLMVPFIRGWTTPTHDRGLRLAVIAVSFLFLLLTGALLVGDLKRPERFLWVLTRPQWRSWLTRGSYILLGFGAGVVALGLAEWFLAAGLVTVLVPVTVVLAASAAVYTAFLFWQSKGRDLWQSPLLPLHLLVQAIVAGLSVTLLICSWGPPVSAQVFAGMAAWLQRALVLNAGLILAELYAAHPTRDATAAARWARSAGRRGLLAGGVGLAGHAIPFVMLFSVHPVAASAAALAVLAGLGCYEHLFVRAGQSVALS